MLSLFLSCKDTKTTIPPNNGEFFDKNSITDSSALTERTPSILQKGIDKKWYGIYKVRFDYGEIGGMNAGWDLEININGENITASGSGYQIGFKDELTATEKGNRLILKHKKNLDGYTLGKNMDPEFVLIEDNGSFYVQSEWIDSDIITKPETNGFKIVKKSNEN
ncbi:hypothetical protein C1637_24725 [Chryseobacterium lactis]|uniref:Uncharacterized protein n=1 Tax=Chryseobacterium lactis TaxID=1241981 RepID=A0A3G6RPW4_CHRLC|nr:hypothetical protein EG342_08445 [Chryseobacterium lactis]AZB06932.1 hypothetical protein EG341_24560 [Chryseobacterium lactis]PNW10983.1 hypothetical protein C1637_24725 [Chryseobacterium lactis]